MWDSEVYFVGTMSLPSLYIWYGGLANTGVTILFIPFLGSGGLANAGVTFLVHYEVLITRLTLVLMHSYISSRMDFGLISPFIFLFLLAITFLK